MSVAIGSTSKLSSKSLSAIIKKLSSQKTHAVPSSTVRNILKYNSRKYSTAPGTFNGNKSRRLNVCGKRLAKARPKSSYGRKSSSGYSKSSDDRISKDSSSTTKVQKESLISDFDLNDIQTLDGESFEVSDDDQDEDDSWMKLASIPWLQNPCIKSVSSGSGTSINRNAKVVITFRFHGLVASHLIRRNRSCIREVESTAPARKIQVLQQIHPGSNSVIVFDRWIRLNEDFQICTRPHENHPFCITILIDGIRDLRISCCCEYKHGPGTKLGHFTILNVQGGFPCGKCFSLTVNISSNIQNEKPVSAKSEYHYSQEEFESDDEDDEGKNNESSKKYSDDFDEDDDGLTISHSSLSSSKVTVVNRNDSEPGQESPTTSNVNESDDSRSVSSDPSTDHIESIEVEDHDHNAKLKRRNFHHNHLHHHYVETVEVDVHYNPY